MKCPVRVMAIPSREAKGIPAVYDCIKEECGFWDKTTQSCPASQIVPILNIIANALINLSKTATLHTGVREQGKPIIM